MARIAFDPNQLGGRPCIRGMRIRVRDVLEFLGAGETDDSILENYPYLTRADISACMSGLLDRTLFQSSGALVSNVAMPNDFHAASRRRSPAAATMSESSNCSAAAQ